MAEVCCSWLAENTERKNSPSGHHHTILSGCIFATKARIDSRKNLLNSNTSSTFPHNMANFCPKAEIGSGVWDTSANFQRLSRLGFVTAATLLTGGQPHFARCLRVSWAVTLYIHFRRHLPLTEFCAVQNSLYVQVLRSPVLAALLHGTPTAGVSQTLRRGTRNGITEIYQRAPPLFGITLGIGPHCS